MRRKIIVSLLALIAAGILVFSLSRKAPEPAPLPAPAGDGFTILESPQGHRVLIEAASAARIEAPLVLKTEPGASPPGSATGRTAYIGPEKWNDNFRAGKVEGEFRKLHPAAQNPGGAHYEFAVPAEDDYTLWLRAWWVDDCGDSVEFSIDGGSPRRVSGSTHGAWTWNRLSLADGGAAKIRLTQGSHTLDLLNREDDLYIDQILLLGSDRTWPDPVDAEK